MNIRIPRQKLAPLTGSEKQIAFASDLREKVIRRREEEYDQAVKRAQRAGTPMPSQAQVDRALAQIAETFNAHTDARWWIDHHREV